MADDPRYRTLVWLGSYFSAANVLEDDDATPCTIHAEYALPTYPLKLVFYGTKNVDVILTVGDPEVTPLIDWQKKAYAYIERVPIEIFTIDKDEEITGEIVRWRAEQELRRIAEVYPLGSVRTFQTMSPTTRPMGGWNLYSKKCVLQYKREADTDPAYPTITWGAAAGTFTFPNVVTLEVHPMSNNTHGINPGRKCSVTQKLGLPDYQIKITCDLDTETTDITWKRPQGGSATDQIKGQVFLDIYYGSQNAEEYQTLNLGWGTTIKVTLEEPHFYLSGDRNMLDIIMYSYNTTEPATYKALFGINP